MTIRLLSEEVAARIAAGEVVERPASVVKELVENSLDAGATHIVVETREGGQKLIRVQDDGEGIPSEEIELAFRRHATSKLERAADLEHIATLGFRGEALASIASVSRVTCITRHRDENVGSRLRIEGGQIVSHSPTGRPPGTELTIQELFYNVPARRKFLRTERTERRHIDAFLTRYAIAYPKVAFHVVHDGREVLSTPGKGAMREVLLNVYGLDLGASLLPISPEFTAGQPVQVTGFVGPTTVHRADRGYITLFINGRWVQDMRLTYAIIQAYHTLLPTKRYPVAIVMVEMPSEEVDVNVHPAKTEVRFHDGDAAFRAVQRAVRATVIEEAPAASSWEAPATPSPGKPAEEESTRARLAALQPSSRQLNLPEPAPATEATAGGAGAETGRGTNSLAPPEAFASRRSQLPPLRIIGQSSTMFIIAEGPDGLYLIDQHAAHERILYEEMMAQWAKGSVPSQPLLEPEVVSLPLDEAARLEEMIPALQTLGLQLDPFGPGAFKVRAVPAALKGVPVSTLLADVAATDPESRSPVRVELEEIIVRRICKRGAIKAGQVLSREEMEALVRGLERAQNPRTCPHGRPTLLQLSVDQLARQFGRGS